tara:strand:+ start:3055 stop:3327 length:273 start_codon:yes stop_codon:yes gene_type:complete
MNKSGELLDNSGELNKLIYAYKETLNEIEKKALGIAINNLETTFCIEKSVGFLKFISERNDKETELINADYRAVGVLSKALGGKRINDGQ